MSDQEAAGEPELNATAIVAALNRHQVRYVIIGAFAAIAQQAPIPATRDIDLTPEASPENLARLSLALEELGARIRTEAVPEHDVEAKYVVRGYATCLDDSLR